MASRNAGDIVMDIRTRLFPTLLRDPHPEIDALLNEMIARDFSSLGILADRLQELGLATGPLRASLRALAIEAVEFQASRRLSARTPNRFQITREVCRSEALAQHDQAAVAAIQSCRSWAALNPYEERYRGAAFERAFPSCFTE